MKRFSKSFFLACLSLVMALALMPSTVFASSEDAPNINYFQVQDRLTALYNNYRNTGFTNIDGVYGKECPNNHAYHRKYTCSYCLAANVIKTSKVKNEYKTIYVSNFPYTYTPDSYVYCTKGAGDSCAGFACFAGFYILGNGKNYNCITRRVGTYSFSAGNKGQIKKVAMIGDLIRFDSSHSAVCMGVKDTGIAVIDCNGKLEENCMIRTRIVPWGSYSTITLSRGKNRLTLAKNIIPQNVKATKHSGNITITWNKVAGADGYQVYRATSKNGTYKKMLTTSKTTYKNTSVVSGKTYYYKVRAYNKYNGFSDVQEIFGKGFAKWSGYSTIVSKKY